MLKSQMKEMLEEAAANVKDMAEVIEEERGKVDAKTPITEKVRCGMRRSTGQLAMQPFLQVKLLRL